MLGSKYCKLECNTIKASMCCVSQNKTSKMYFENLISINVCPEIKFLNFFGCTSSDGLCLNVSITLRCVIHVPRCLSFFINYFHPLPWTLLGPPVCWFSQISNLATVKFLNMCYRLNVLKIISVWQRYILVEKQWIA